MFDDPIAATDDELIDAFHKARLAYARSRRTLESPDAALADLIQAEIELSQRTGPDLMKQYRARYPMRDDEELLANDQMPHPRSRKA